VRWSIYTGRKIALLYVSRGDQLNDRNIGNIELIDFNREVQVQGQDTRDRSQDNCQYD
jgi:hypothetical protein